MEHRTSRPARVAALLGAGVILGSALAPPSASADGTLAEQVQRLRRRVRTLEQDQGYLQQQASQLDSNGTYYGVIRRWQVRLGEDSRCLNGMPRNAVWDGGELAC
jgi:hypothetical protein